MSNSGGGLGNSRTYNTSNYTTNNTTNKSTPIGADTTSGAAAAGYKSTFNITNKTGGSKVALAALSGGGQVAQAALNANNNATDAALSFASSAGKAELNLLQSATGQVLALAGKKVQTQAQAATGTTPTQSSKTVEYGVVGLVGLGAAYLLMRKR